MSSMNFPDPNVTPEYKDWVWDGEKWVKDCPASGGSGGSGGIGEAPEDGVQYARQDAAWSPVEAYDDSGITDGLAQEVADREAGDLALRGQIEAGDLALQGQIDALGSGGSSYEVIESVDLSGADQYDFDLFPDTHTDFKALFYIGFPVNTFGSPTLEIKVNGDTELLPTPGSPYQTVNFLPNNATGQSFENKFFSITPTGTVQTLPHVFGEINFHTANLTFSDTDRHNVSAFSVSGNGKIINIGGAVKTDQGDKFTGFRFKTSRQISSGYFRLVGIRKN